MKRLLLLSLILVFGVISCTTERYLADGTPYDVGHQEAYTNEYVINGEYYSSTIVMHRYTDNSKCRTTVDGNYTTTICE